VCFVDSPPLVRASPWPHCSWRDAGGLAACTPAVDAGPTPAPTPIATDTASSAATPTPNGPALHPNDSAEANLPLFAQVTGAVWASSGSSSGRAYIDALVEAGFDKSAMQVTQDATTVGNAVESLQFSVRWGESECLVGQVGPSTGNPVTKVMDQLAEGRCLIGDTRSIDW